MVEDKEDFEIGDVENFQGNKDKQFSHSSLVMAAMRKCMEFGAMEMREGWFNEKTDMKGNLIRTYISDTRKQFIESIRTLKMIMACDLDSKARERLKKYLLAIKNKEKELIQMDNEAWNRLPEHEKAHHISKGRFHFERLINYPGLKKHLIEFELEQWRKVFAELSRLTKRLDFYKAESFEA